MPRARKPSKRRSRNPRPPSEFTATSDAVADIYAPAGAVANDIADIIPIRPSARLGHPHLSGEGTRNAADLKRYERNNYARFLDERKSEYHAAALKRSLAMLPAELRRSEDEIYDDYVEHAPAEVVEQGRGAVVRWAAMRAHEDMAAAILAVGGNQHEAALHAGVAPSTVARMMKRPEFVARVVGERRRLLGRVQGGALAELERRVFSGESLMMDTRDLLAVIQRTGDLGGDQVAAPPRPQAGVGGGAGAAGHNGGGVTIYNQLAAIAAPAPQRAIAGGSAPESDSDDRGGVIEGTFTVPEDADFPVLGLGGDTVAEEVPPLDG